MRPLDVPPPLTAFLTLFNQGSYWAAHESLEEVWRKTRSPFYHGLILYASAWVHCERQNRAGVIAQLDKAEPVLRQYQPGYLGIDLAAVLSDGSRLRAMATEGRLAEVVRPRISPVLALVHGSEPELAIPD